MNRNNECAKSRYGEVRNENGSRVKIRPEKTHSHPRQCLDCGDDGATASKLTPKLCSQRSLARLAPTLRQTALSRLHATPFGRPPRPSPSAPAMHDSDLVASRPPPAPCCPLPRHHLPDHGISPAPLIWPPISQTCYYMMTVAPRRERRLKLVHTRSASTHAFPAFDHDIVKRACASYRLRGHPCPHQCKTSCVDRPGGSARKNDKPVPVGLDVDIHSDIYIDIIACIRTRSPTP